MNPMITQDQIKQITNDKGRTYEVEHDGDLLKLPSVTTIINFTCNKPALVPWAYKLGVQGAFEIMSDDSIATPLSEGELRMAMDERELGHKDALEKGSSRGIDVHDALEAIIRGNEYDYSLSSKSFINTLMKFIEDYDPEWLLTEYKVASLEYEYAGQFDAVCIPRKHPPRRRHEDLTGLTCLIDIKTNTEGRVYPETHLPQVEAYSKAYKEMGGEYEIDRNVVIGIGPEGKFQPCVSYARFETFKKILDLYTELQWLKNNNPNKRK
jgi:hypothetical protein